MQLAINPTSEMQRLDAVHRLNLLDSQAEERFDRITRIAHNLFDIPSVFITLVDKNRVWFKSKYGYDESEEPRDNSFCGCTVNNIVTKDASSRLFEVIDAQQDDRFFNNTIVEKYNVRYYLGFVLRSKDHFNIGTFCAADTRQRSFSTNQKSMFMDLGLMAQAELNNHQNYLQHEQARNESCGKNEKEDYSDRLVRLFNVMASVQTGLNHSLKRHGLNFKDWLILNEINQNEFTLPSSLSNKLGFAPPAMTNKLDKLEIRHLIKRCHPTGGDRRCIRRLTASRRRRRL